MKAEKTVFSLWLIYYSTGITSQQPVINNLICDDCLNKIWEKSSFDWYTSYNSPIRETLVQRIHPLKEKAFVFCFVKKWSVLICADISSDTEKRLVIFVYNQSSEFTWVVFLSKISKTCHTMFLPGLFPGLCISVTRSLCRKTFVSLLEQDFAFRLILLFFSFDLQQTLKRICTIFVC